VRQTGLDDWGNTWTWDNVVWISSDANNDEWWSRLEHRDLRLVNGQLYWGTQQNYDDSGVLRTLAEYDVDGGDWYWNYTNEYDTAGNFVRQTGLDDAGNSWSGTWANGTWAALSHIDTGNTANWSRIDYTNYNATLGQWETTSTFNDNGTRDEVRNDVNHDEGWTESRTHFDASGNVESQTVRNDDGTSVEAHINRDENSDILRTETVRDEHGNVTAELTAMKDGSRIAEIKVEGGEVAFKLTWNGDNPDIVQVGGPLLTIPLAAAALEQALMLFGALGAAKIIHEYGVKPFILYMRGGESTQTQDRVFVGELTQERIDQFCPDTGRFQALTTMTAAGISRDGLTPQAYGSRVHAAIATQVRDMQDPDIRAEFSLIGGRDDLPYGTQGSTRLDIFQYRPETNTVCIYDIKTGNAGLDNSYLNRAIAEAQRWREGAHIMVLELRP
jgi:hypothetical protein